MIRETKSVLRYLQACLLRGAGLLWLAKRRAAKRGVVVLTLHRVLEDDEFFRSSSLPGILLRKQTFQQLVSWAAKNFEVLDLSKGAPDWNRSATHAARIAFSFDDGWLDNYEVAAPILLHHRTPATIFICPGLMDKRFPFWPERVSRLVARAPGFSSIREIVPDLSRAEHTRLAEALIEHLKQMPPHLRDDHIARLENLCSTESSDASVEPLNRTMTWEQVQELHDSGIQMGSHTVSHQILTSLPADTVATELMESRRQIEAGLGAPCTMLAYPNGNHNETAVRASADAGYTIAFTTKQGLWKQQTDLLRVPRVNVSERKLTGPSGRFSRAMTEYSLFWNLKA